LANSQVPSGTSDEAGRLWTASISSAALVARNNSCAIDRNQEISSLLRQAAPPLAERE
jgi:hypothetical protein